MASPADPARVSEGENALDAELELLQGFKHAIRLLDTEDGGVNTAKKLLAEYLPLFKKAAERLPLNKANKVQSLSWNAIIRITKESGLFLRSLDVLIEVNPDLKYKPRADCPGLNEFAHSTQYLWDVTTEKVISELRAMGMDQSFITMVKIDALKLGLLEEDITIDGLRKPYQVLLPFLALGCLKIKRLKEDRALGKIDLKRVVSEALEDAATSNVVSAMNPGTTRGSSRD